MHGGKGVAWSAPSHSPEALGGCPTDGVGHFLWQLGILSAAADVREAATTVDVLTSSEGAPSVGTY